MIMSNQEIALIVLRGKRSTANSLATTIEFFRDREFTVVDPMPPWSNDRNFDETYESMLLQLNQQVQDLKNSRAKKIVLVGQSFGANCIFAYLSLYADIDAAVTMAPAHFPDRMYQNNHSIRILVDLARKLARKGQSSFEIAFNDSSSGDMKRINTTVENFLSYFDPAGLANMYNTIPQITRSIPILYISAQDDEQRDNGDDKVSMLPENEKTKYVKSDQTHFRVGISHNEEILEFIKSLDS